MFMQGIINTLKTKMPGFLSVLGILSVFTVGVYGHGRLLDPPGRSTCWRYGFKECIPNYNDNQLFCGGFQRQVNNGGKCGVCGDAIDDPPPRDNEAGGRFARGVIVRTYGRGHVIKVRVHVTASHQGFFEFRLCVNNNVNKAITHDCLNRHLLEVTNGNGYGSNTQYHGRPGQTSIDRVDIYDVGLKLPPEVTCSQCVLQWRYHTGNSWGCDNNGGHRNCGLGKGHQEEFYGCADIAIE